MSKKTDWGKVGLGVGLILFPDPATTTLGVGIVGHETVEKIV